MSGEHSTLDRLGARMMALIADMRGVQHRPDGTRLPAMWIGVIWVLIAAVQFVGLHRIIITIALALALAVLAVSSAAALIIAAVIDGAAP
jgi:hypothetical protein